MYSFVQLAYAKLTIIHYDPWMCDQAKDVLPPVVLAFRDIDQGPWGMRRIAWSTRIGSRQMPFQRSANSCGNRASSWVLIRISMFASTLYIIFSWCFNLVVFNWDASFWQTFLSKWKQEMDDLEAINKEIANDIVEEKASADDAAEEVSHLEMWVSCKGFRGVLGWGPFFWNIAVSSSRELTYPTWGRGKSSTQNLRIINSRDLLIDCCFGCEAGLETCRHWFPHLVFFSREQTERHLLL